MSSILISGIALDALFILLLIKSGDIFEIFESSLKSPPVCKFLLKYVLMLNMCGFNAFSNFICSSFDKMLLSFSFVIYFAQLLLPSLSA